MHVAMNSELWWDQSHLQLWMLLMSLAWAVSGDKSDSDHVVNRQSNATISRSVTVNVVQKCPLGGGGG